MNRWTPMWMVAGVLVMGCGDMETPIDPSLETATIEVKGMS